LYTSSYLAQRASDIPKKFKLAQQAVDIW